MTDINENKSYPQINITEVIRSKNPRLLKVIPRFVIRKLEKIVHTKDLNQYLKDNHDKDAYEFLAEGVKMFGAKIHINGQENIPQGKRLLFAANHPLGGLDGVVFMHVVHQLAGELKFPVNDLLYNLPNLRPVFLPVNKHGSMNREAAKAIDEAYSGNCQILYFPAGLCSRKIKGKIVDLEWKSSFISQAVRYQRDVVPVHIKGQNSKFFYNLANWRKRLGIKANIEMLFLVDEMYNQYNRDITLTFGEPIPWQTFGKDHSSNHWANFVRQKVYSLAK
jgi:putative hemolysin